VEEKVTEPQAQFEEVEQEAEVEQEVMEEFH